MIVKDIFSLYVFLEITAISSFILIAFEKDVYALEGSFKYLMLSVLATTGMLLAISFIYMMAGSLRFDGLHAAMQNAMSGRLIAICLAFFVAIALMARRNVRLGAATLCVGGGQGMAMVLQRLS